MDVLQMLNDSMDLNVTLARWLVSTGDLDAAVLVDQPIYSLEWNKWDIYERHAMAGSWAELAVEYEETTGEPPEAQDMSELEFQIYQRDWWRERWAIEETPSLFQKQAW